MNRGTWRKKGLRIRNLIGLACVILVPMVLTAGAVWASSSEHEAAAKGFVATDFYRIMNFVVLAVALFIIIKKFVVPIFRDRVKGIKDELDELEAKKQEAEKVLAQYNERLSLLDQEAEKIKSSYIEQGKEAQARILEQAKASVEKLEANAHRQIETAFERARAELQGVILEKAIEKAEAKIRKNISAEDQDRLVDDYLEKVVA